MEINPEDRIIIIGCGYTGQRIAAYGLAAGADVHGVVRSDEQASILRGIGVTVHQLDFDQPSLKLDLPLAGALLYYCMPPQRSDSMDDLRMAVFVRNIMELPADKRPRAIVYLSTTGVYGDCRGAWVTETSLPAPLSPRASRRLAAENRLRGLHDRAAIPITVLRVAAIYGPGRLPVDAIRAGRPVLNDAEAPFFNRIHVDDLARVCIAASLRCQDWQVYNVSDGHPETITTYFNRVADLSGLRRPRAVSWAEAQANLPPGMLDFLKESRKVDNLNMLNGLDIKLQYPDADSGLRACLEELD
jgi:nucleoside-diphosphate-sugar epimerase